MAAPEVGTCAKYEEMRRPYFYAKFQIPFEGKESLKNPKLTLNTNSPVGQCLPMFVILFILKLSAICLHEMENMLHVSTIHIICTI